MTGKSLSDPIKRIVFAEHKYFVDGQWKVSKSGETLSIQSSYLDGEIGRVQSMTIEEIDAAIKSAKHAQKSWSKEDMKVRARLLRAWATQLVADKDEIATTIMNEVGKTFSDAEKEVLRTADLINFTVEEFLHMSNESLSAESYPHGSRNKFAIIDRVPLGVILAIGPFNYPVNLTVSKIVPALMSGNTVIFKPATRGSISGVKLVESFAKVEGFPPGILQLITGRGNEIGDYMIQHDDINMITFTGSTRNGQNISQLAKMTPAVMELGGKDPAIVTANADLDKTVREIVSGAFGYSGQRCTAIKRVLVVDEVADELVKRLSEAIAKLKVGTPNDGDVAIVPLINEKAADFVEDLINDAKKKGAKIIVGGNRDKNLIYPTLIDNVTTQMRFAWEEQFGPVLPILRVRDVEQAIKITNDSEYGLQASIFSEDFTESIKIARELEVGSVQINGQPQRGPDSFPFLGAKNSGMGSQGVKNALLSMTREKLTVINL